MFNLITIHSCYTLKASFTRIRLTYQISQNGIFCWYITAGRTFVYPIICLSVKFCLSFNSPTIIEHVALIKKNACLLPLFIIYSVFHHLCARACVIKTVTYWNVLFKRSIKCICTSNTKMMWEAKRGPLCRFYHLDKIKACQLLFTLCTARPVIS